MTKCECNANKTVWESSLQIIDIIHFQEDLKYTNDLSCHG